MTERSRSFKVTEAHNAFEAVMLMVSGYFYFLSHGWKIAISTLLISGAALTGVVIGSFDYYQLKTQGHTIQIPATILPESKHK